MKNPTSFLVCPGLQQCSNHGLPPFLVQLSSPGMLELQAARANPLYTVVCPPNMTFFLLSSLLTLEKTSRIDGSGFIASSLPLTSSRF